MWVPSTEPKPDGGPFTAEKVPCRTLRSISNQGVTRTESWFWVRVSPEVFARVVQKFLSALKPYLGHKQHPVAAYTHPVPTSTLYHMHPAIPPCYLSTLGNED